MASKGHNNPPVTIDLEPEEAAFLVDNCNANLEFSLRLIQGVSRDAAEKLVAQMEMFKAVKLKIERAIK